MRSGALSLLCCLLLCGCSRSEELTDAFQETADETVPSQTHAETMTEAIHESVFSGLPDAGTTAALGNTMSCLGRNGRIYQDEKRLIYCSSTGDLVLKEGAKEMILRADVFPKCINVMDENVYFIDSTNGDQVCSVDLNGEDYKVYLAQNAVFFALSNDFAVYQNEANDLYLYSSGESKLISDKKALWVDLYGQYIIYTELENDCNVKAYNIYSGETEKLLDYGFFPTVIGDTLYYQEQKNGYICTLDLVSGASDTFLSQWGQHFCQDDGIFYYLTSNGIQKKENDAVTEAYHPDDGTVVDSLFVCGGALYFTETSDGVTHLICMKPKTGERIVIT